MKQLTLPLRDPRGGKRPGAGRKSRDGRRGHARRPILGQRHPVHVTLRLASNLPGLRKKEIFRCLREAVRTARKSGFSVAHFSILSNHLHLIIEPREPRLGRLFQSLCISFAKRVNRARGQGGAVFHDRYHMHVLRTPAEVRSAVAYVLTNESRHRFGKRRTLRVKIDPFSSGWAFRDWRVLLGNRVQFEITGWSEATIENWYDEILSLPRTWLLSTGWKRVKAS